MVTAFLARRSVHQDWSRQETNEGDGDAQTFPLRRIDAYWTRLVRAELCSFRAVMG